MYSRVHPGQEKVRARETMLNSNSLSTYTRVQPQQAHPATSCRRFVRCIQHAPSRLACHRLVRGMRGGALRTRGRTRWRQGGPGRGARSGWRPGRAPRCSDQRKMAGWLGRPHGPPIGLRPRGPVTGRSRQPPYRYRNGPLSTPHRYFGNRRCRNPTSRHQLDRLPACNLASFVYRACPRLHPLPVSAR